MSTWISLLRGINVGGRNLLPMLELRELLAGLGYDNVRTYIQSGNCLFESRETSVNTISKSIGRSILEQYGFEPSVITMSVERLHRTIRQCPYDPDIHDHKNIQIFFFSKQPTSVDSQALQALKHPTEQYEISTDVFYLLAPEGIARSKLAAKAEGTIGVPMTARNYRTVMKLEQMCTQG